MADEPETAPVLSTPAEHLFEHIEPEALVTETQVLQRSGNELRQIYEVRRAAREIHNAGYRRVALQFPDSMLGDAPRLVELLKEELARSESETKLNKQEDQKVGAPPKLYILADTSYSACCADEIAAEHVDADAIIHYGRSCLSPTSRLPVIYVFTQHDLDRSAVGEAVEREFPDKDAEVIVMADVSYQDHCDAIVGQLQRRGYNHILSTAIVHNPTAVIPNRDIVDAHGQVVDVELKEYAVYHISTPPTSLLLALSSRVRSLHIHPISSDPPASSSGESFMPPTRALLGRRYAKVLSLATASIIGILVNTLSVSNYLSSIDVIKDRIAAAGKKSYTVVVGKLNPAKLANFAEVDGWVVVGCWESSLVEDDSGFYRPVITPFELEVALMRDNERIWGDRWWGGIEAGTRTSQASAEQTTPMTPVGGDTNRDAVLSELDDDESEPPVFDLRTGRLVSNSRPMRISSATARENETPRSESLSSDVLTLRSRSEVATVKGAFSPGAEFLRSQRTWQGLETDFNTSERSAAVEEGRRGVARGYTVGENAERT